MKRLFAVALLLLLSACVTAPPLWAPAGDQTLPPPPPDKAQIVFVSPGNPFSLAGHVYEIQGSDKALLGTLGPKTKMAILATPGRHLFMSNSVGFGHFLQADVEAGKRYYVLLRYVHGRGLQLRPIRPVGPSDFSVANPKFAEWIGESQVVVKTADTDGWNAKYKSFADDAYTRGWADWLEKRPDQQAELTLNREDSILR